MNPPTPRSMLEQISTRWPMIQSPVQFVMRYARAIQRYVAAMLRDPHEAEEVTQDFLLKVLAKGFCPENVSRGRFRDYLRSAVRYVAISHLRKGKPSLLGESELAELTREEAPADAAWQADWREVLLERVWQGLEAWQQSNSGNLYYTVLRQFTSDASADSTRHAARLSESTGKPVTPESFRQTLHRARRQFAQILVDEVRRTLESPTAASVEEELIDLELMPYVRDFLKKK